MGRGGEGGEQGRKELGAEGKREGRREGEDDYEVEVVSNRKYAKWTILKTLGIVSHEY